MVDRKGMARKGILARRLLSKRVAGTMRRGGALLAGVTLMLALVLAGCGKEPSKPPAPTKPAKAPAPTLPPGKVQEYIEKPTFDIAGYVYHPADRRDPFHSLIDEQKRRAGKKDHIPPLQRFSLAEMRVIGIAWSPGGYLAMLEMPDGRGYSVKVGSTVGRNKGVVKQITPKGLVVEETLPTGFGVVQKRNVTLELQSKEVIP